MMRSDLFSFYEDEELGLVFYSPNDSFEVDGIVYTPPWKAEHTDPFARHPGPMLDIKD